VKFPAYPRTKPSGVEWLGDIAHDWHVSPIKRLVSTPVTDGPHETPEIFDEGIPFVSAEAVSAGRINFRKIRGHITFEDHKRFSRKYKPRRGDIYLIKSGATTGRVAMVETDIEFNIWSPLAAIRCDPKRVDVNFVFFYMQSKEFQTAVELSWSFGTQQNIGMGVIQNLAVPLPSLPEQVAIAAFLCRKTGQVDQLVAKKRELIMRLKEERTAIISRTVTHGLPVAAARAAGIPANAPLKPSGIEWIGDIPKHWDVVAYKRVCTRVDVGIAEAATHAYCDDGVPIIRSTNVKPNKLDTSDVLRIEPWFAAKNRTKTLRAGDLVTVRTGYPGTTAIVPPEFDGCQCFTLVLSTPKRTAHGPFFAWVLNSNAGTSYFEMEGWGTAQTNISVPIVRFMPVPRPPLPEQVAIAAYLDLETAKLDALVSKVEEAVERLQEYRTALITAAVTGKIDVRKRVAA
jgi:type I restriction enzyme S subunit